MLAFNTWADLKEKEIDSRRNWFMYGVILSMVLIMRLNFWFYLFFLFATVGFTKLIKRMFLEGDAEALRWILPGFFMLNLSYGLVFLASFALTTLVHLIARRKLNITQNTAGYPILLGAYIITVAFALKI